MNFSPFVAFRLLKKSVNTKARLSMTVGLSRYLKNDYSVI